MGQRAEEREVVMEWEEVVGLAVVKERQWEVQWHGREVECDGWVWRGEGCWWPWGR